MLARFRVVLALVAVVAAAAIAARAAFGPLQFGAIQFVSPLGVESVFGVLVLFLAFSKKHGEPVARSADRFPALATVVVLIIVCALFAGNVADPYLSDDYVIMSQQPISFSSMVRFFTPEYPPGDGAFRPVGVLYFGLLRPWARLEPFRAHLLSLVLHLANCALLIAIVWSIWRHSLMALSAGLLFGLHATRPEAVAWSAAAFDPLATLFSLSAALCVFHRYSDSAPRRCVAAALLLFVLAIWSKESAYVVPFLVLAFAFAGRMLDRPAVRWFLAGSVLLAALLFIHRWGIFGGPGGYPDPSTGVSQVLSLRPLSALKGLLIRVWAILWFPVNWDALKTLPYTSGAILLGCGTMAALLVAGRPIERRVVVSMLAMTVLAMVPAVHFCLVGQSLRDSRVFYLPSVCFCVLCAHLIASASSRVLQRTALGVVSVCYAVMLLHNLGAWHRTALLADQLCTAAAAKPPATSEGVYLFANGYPECVALKTGR